MTHRDELMTFSDEDEQHGSVLERIRDGSKAMAVARRTRDGLDLEFSGECVLEEAVLCAVLNKGFDCCSRAFSFCKLLLIYETYS